MSFSLRFSRSSSDPRPTIRQRLHNAAASIKERVSRRHRKGGGTDASRRALVAGSLATAAAIPFGAYANDATGDAELFRLLSEFEKAYARREEIDARCAATVDACMSAADASHPLPDQIIWQSWNEEERGRFASARDEAFGSHYHGNPELAEPWAEERRLWDETLTPLARQILATKSVTPAGVSLKARFLVEHGGSALGFWIDAETDPERTALLGFVKQVAALAPSALH